MSMHTAESNASMCALCQSIFTDLSFERWMVPADDNDLSAIQPSSLEAEPWTFRITFHGNKQSIREAMDLGCPICLEVPWNLDKPFEESCFRLWKRANGDLSFYELMIHVAHRSENGEAVWQAPFRKRIVPYLEQENEWEALASRARIETRVGGDGAFELARKWMASCIEDHRSCNSNYTPTRYPTRLLDVSHETIRLVESNTISPDAPYVTLSHCWGKQPFLVLTSNNKGSFERGVSSQIFPQTFQDVISAVKKLGFRYLWIDSYCIVQSGVGAKEDKTKEIAQMDDVYANAILNIGASGSTGPFHGCFRDRQATPEPLTLCWRPTSNDERQQWRIHHQRAINGYRSFFDRLPLLKRGWVLQERLLCSRMLHIGKDSLYWECNKIRHASESFPLSVDALGYPISRYPFSINPRGQSRLEQSLTFIWTSIVILYSSMALSHPSEDKLVAVSGIAKRAATMAGDTYAAGVFRGRVISQLCWHSAGHVNTRAKPWRAPTWSWASIDGPIGWPIYSGPELACAVESNLSMTTSGDVYGQIETTKLLIIGRLLHVTLHARKQDGRNDRLLLRYGKTNFYVIFDDPEERREDLHILPTQHIMDQRLPKRENESEVAYIVLRKTTRNTYKRIGSWDRQPCAEDGFREMMSEQPQIFTLE